MKNIITTLILTLLVFVSCDDSPSFQEQLDLDKEIIRTYLNINNLQATETASGLNYIITRPGNGSDRPNINDQVTIYYKGYFPEDNTVFDQTPVGTPTTFGVSQVVPGFSEALQLLRKNGKGTFLLPSYLAYGTSGRGTIPANAVLIFDIELLDF